MVLLRNRFVANLNDQKQSVVNKGIIPRKKRILLQTNTDSPYVIVKRSGPLIRFTFSCNLYIIVQIEYKF